MSKADSANWIIVQSKTASTFLYPNSHINPRVIIYFSVNSNLTVDIWHENTLLDKQKLAD